jgi:hypothetical protein
MAGFWDSLIKLWDSTAVQLVVFGSILALMVVIAFLVLRKLRDSAVSNEQGSLELLTNFREMKVQGDISDQEFRTIKALLNEKQASTIKPNQDSI